MYELCKIFQVLNLCKEYVEKCWILVRKIPSSCKECGESTETLSFWSAESM